MNTLYESSACAVHSISLNIRALIDTVRYFGDQLEYPAGKKPLQQSTVDILLWDLAKPARSTLEKQAG